MRRINRTTTSGERRSGEEPDRENARQIPPCAHTHWTLFHPSIHLTNFHMTPVRRPCLAISWSTLDRDVLVVTEHRPTTNQCEWKGDGYWCKLCVWRKSSEGNNNSRRYRPRVWTRRGGFKEWRQCGVFPLPLPRILFHYFFFFFLCWSFFSSFYSPVNAFSVGL